ncbi:MAG: pyridoxal phosphate-dependent aminotransferase [Chloroflexi bacterium]|nr:pyridoxal phosphate-dependent aminotransferase [Chloroflexota bacterium]
MRNMAAARTQEIGPSATLQVARKARELRAQGVDVVDFGPGEPDFDTPRHIIDAACDAMHHGFTHYVPSRGVKELLEALSEKLRKENGIEANPETDIIVTPSGKQALLEVLMAVVNPGDEVIIFDPSWVSYEACIRLAGGIPVKVALSFEDNFAITDDKFRPVLSPATKAIIVNSPNNPTGRILTMDELNVISTVAQERDLLVVSDEMYEKMAYEGHVNRSMAALPGMLDRTVTLNGFSKSYAMTGWRLGYAVAPAVIMREVLKVQEHSVTCAASFTQIGGVAALKGTQEPIEAMIAEFGRRREVIAQGLNELPGVSVRKPEGTFYAFPSIRGTGLSSTEFAALMLDKAHVALTPGVAFGEAGEGYVRTSFATSMEDIQRGLRRMSEVLG